MRKLLAAALLSFMTPVPALAQMPNVDLAAQRSAMAALDRMHGKWLGQGDRFTKDGATYRFTQTMEIEPESDGLIMTISAKSLHHGDATEKKPGSGSFAVVTYDDASKAYLFRSFGFGNMIPAKAELVSPDVFRWTVAGPLMIRFTIDLTTDGVWQELGERSTDGGTTWTPTNKLTAYRTAGR